MESSDFVRLMRQEFSVLCNPVDQKPYLFRFEYDNRSLDLPTNERGKAFAPITILRLLAKFDFKDSDFRNAYNRFFSLTKQE